MKKQIYVKYSNERDDKFKIKTIIYKDENDKKIVEKIGLTPLAKDYVKTFEKSYNYLKRLSENTKFSLGEFKLKKDCAEFEYFEGITFDNIIDKYIKVKDYKKVVEIISDFQNQLEKLADTQFLLTDEFIKFFGKPSLPIIDKAISYADIDLIFNNIIVTEENKWNIIDYEWSFDFPVPIKFILYRAIFYYGTSDRESLCRKDIFDLGIFKILNISDEEIEVFKNMELNFQEYVTGNNHPLWDLYPMQKEYNVVDLIEKEKEKEKFVDYIDVFYDRGNDFNGEERDVFNFSVDNINKFVINVDERVKRLRIDPGNYCCIVNLNKLCAVEYNCYNFEIEHNGINIDDNKILFSTSDPQIIINKIEPLTIKIKVEFEYEMISIDAAIGIFKGLSDKDYFKRIKDENCDTIRNLTMLVKEKEGEIKGVSEALGNEIKNVKTEKDQLVKVMEEKQSTIDFLENNCTELQKEKEQINKEFETVVKKINERDKRYEELMAQYSEKNNQFNDLARRNGELEYNYNNILNSTCWKITKPIRIIINPVKSLLAHNKYTSLFYKGLWSLKFNGLKNTLQRVKLWRLKRKMISNVELTSFDGVGEAVTMSMAEIASLDSLNKSIAVHAHLYYEDLLDEFVSYFNNIPFKFDLYVSIKKENNIKDITVKLKNIKNVVKVDVRETINRGRDIAPLYVQFGDEIVKHDYFLHIHTKKSLYSGVERYGWRQYALDSLLGSEEVVRKIFSLFENENEKIGLFYPETYEDMPIIAQDWLGNAYEGRIFLESLGIKFEGGMFNYPVGSFFWARTDALKPIFDKRLKLEDFPEEAGQTDRTLAHVLERAIAFVAKSRGYKLAIYDKDNANVALGKSLKAYRPYFAHTLDSTKYYLNQFDIVTFDIFDTLITRCVYKPDDAFLLINKKIKKELGLDFDFLALRKEAETLAWNRKKEYCSINDIYEDFLKTANITKEAAEKIKRLEIETELELSIPRKDMVVLFNYLKENKKKIILISDMYLTSKEISKMLEKCGYTGYSELWVSCEKGVRKDNRSMWNTFFEIYGKYNTVHVGDNAHSDIQMLDDIGKATFYVMNPVVAFKLSSFYDRFKEYLSTTVENSILLGLVVNGNLFNSPFNVDMRGEPVIETPYKLGYIGFSPLFTHFIHWVEETAMDNENLMFLAREGYLFEQIYLEYCKILNIDASKGKYFLASRRAVSVAAIKGKEDIESILGQYYRGSLSNLLKARLGLDLYPDMIDIQVSMADDLGKVMSMLENHIDDILQRAENERKNYLSYIDSICDNRENIAVVDVGYSGTIQFYLSKLIDCKINGYYLSTSPNKKPETIGCKCYSIYPVFSSNEEGISKVFNKQLFLEAALKAPFGQLVCFEKENGSTNPVYKDDRIVSDEIVELQKGIIDFTNNYLTLLKGFSDKPEIDKRLVEDLFDYSLSGNNFSEETAKIFSVQDDYCSNGNQVYDMKEKKWKVVKNN